MNSAVQVVTTKIQRHERLTTTNRYKTERRCYECEDCKGCSLKEKYTKSKGNRGIQVGFRLKELKSQRKS